MSQRLLALLKEAQNADFQRRAQIQNEIMNMILTNKEIGNPNVRKSLAEEVAKIYSTILMAKPGRLVDNYLAIAILGSLPVDWSLVK